MSGEYCGPEHRHDPRPCIAADDAAAAAAKRAVKDTFAILGVDVDSPKDVEEFRKDLRFGGMMRKAADNGVMTLIALLITAAVVAMFAGVGLRNH